MLHELFHMFCKFQNVVKDDSFDTNCEIAVIQSFITIDIELIYYSVWLFG